MLDHLFAFIIKVCKFAVQEVVLQQAQLHIIQNKIVVRSAEDGACNDRKYQALQVTVSLDDDFAYLRYTALRYFIEQDADNIFQAFSILF